MLVEHKQLSVCAEVDVGVGVVVMGPRQQCRREGCGVSGPLICQGL